MKRTTLAALGLILIPTAHAQSDAAKAQRMRFHWPIPCSATVTQSTLKKGRRATTSYTVSLLRDKGSSDLLLKIRDFRFVAMQGVDLKNPVVQAQLRPALAMAQAIPDLRLSSAGKVKGFEDFEKTVARVLAFLAKQDSPNKQRHEQVIASVKRVFANPAMGKAIEASASEFWDAWVGVWLSSDSYIEGKATKHAYELPMSSARIKGKMEVTMLRGKTRERPNDVEMKAQCNSDAKSALKAVLEAMLGAMTPAQRANFQKEMIEKARIQTQMTATLDPDTTRPSIVKSEKRITIGIKGQPVRSTIERHEWRFEWKRLPPRKEAASPNRK